jgi:thiamine-monophosphate kinase
MREFDLIKLASEIFRTKKEEVLAGAGEDDCAVIRIGNKNVLLTADSLHERTDFPPGMLPEEMGHMALAVNLSDIAGSGGKPHYFLFTITLPEEKLFKGILNGMANIADRYDVSVVGGDIDSGDELAISGFAIGTAERYVKQSGAIATERVCLTGSLGKAQLSLEQLFSGFSRDELTFPDKLFTPEPRVFEGIELAGHVSAMTDVSDSLAVSLNLISEKSGKGIVIEKSLLPLEHLTEFVNEEKALDLFLYSGGDYELVYTSKECTHGFEIGKVVNEKGVWLKTKDEKKRIEFKGYSHF